MEFVETSIFSKYVKNHIDDESYRSLQSELVGNPKIGTVLQKTGGARKMRWASKGAGKSGGFRIIYFYASSEDCCYMLLAFGKSEQDTLTDVQKRT